MLASVFEKQSEVFLIGAGSYSVAFMSTRSICDVYVAANSNDDIPHKKLRFETIGIQLRTPKVHLAIPTTLSSDIILRMSVAAILKKHKVHDAMLPVTDFAVDKRCAAVKMHRGLVTMDEFMKINMEEFDQAYLTFVHDMVHAVCDLWRVGLVHTDIKDRNVMLTSDGFWRLIDIAMDADNTLKNEVSTEYSCKPSKQNMYHTYGWNEVQESLAALFATTVSELRVTRCGSKITTFFQMKDDAFLASDTAKCRVTLCTAEEQTMFGNMMQKLRTCKFDTPDVLLADSFVKGPATAHADDFRPICQHASLSPCDKVAFHKQNLTLCTAKEQPIDALLTPLPTPSVLFTAVVESLKRVVTKIRAKMGADADADTLQAWQLVVLHATVSACMLIEFKNPTATSIEPNKLVVLCMWPALALNTKNVFSVSWMDRVVPFTSAARQEVVSEIVVIAMRSLVQHRELVKSALFDPVTFSAEHNTTAELIRRAMKAFRFRSFADAKGGMIM